MAMGRRKRRERQKDLWIAASELPTSGGHPFYRRLSELLDKHDFDVFVEGECEKFYAPSLGRPKRMRLLLRDVEVTTAVEIDGQAVQFPSSLSANPDRIRFAKTGERWSAVNSFDTPHRHHS